MKETLLAKKGRIKILQFIQAQKIPPTYKEIQAHMGFSSAVAARYQVGVLIEDGLVERIGGHRGIIVSPLGVLFLEYLTAALTEETVIERKIRESGKIPNRDIKRDLVTRAQRQDEDSFARRQQLIRRKKGAPLKSGQGNRELERKIESVKLLEIVGRHTCLTEAAKEAGIVPSSLRERLDGLVK
jgi:SOS-response transcriptional repressor LexA